MLARRLLIAGSGGSFTPPIPTPPNSPGSPTTILDDTYYNAWPSVARMQSGDLIVLYTKGVQHAGNNNSNPDIKISADDGATWGAETNIYDHASLKVEASGVYVSPTTGRVFATLWRDDETSQPSGEAGLCYSDDDGATWTGWIDLTNTFAQEAYASGPLLELPGGDLLAFIEGTDSGSALNRSCRSLRSTDGGDTWGDETVVRAYATDTRPYYETCPLLLDTGELIVIHRTSGGTGTHYVQRSSDQGATSGGWGTPYVAFAGYGRPHTIQHSTLGLLAVTRKNSDASVVAFTSVDRGLTWDAGTVIASGMTEMEYGCPVELLDGTILVVYGDQPTGSTTNADLKQVILT